MGTESLLDYLDISADQIKLLVKRVKKEQSQQKKQKLVKDLKKYVYTVSVGMAYVEELNDSQEIEL